VHRQPRRDDRGARCRTCARAVALRQRLERIGPHADGLRPERHTRAVRGSRRGRRVTALCTISAQLLDRCTRLVVWRGTATKRVGVERRNVAGVVDGLAAAARATVDRLVADMEVESASPCRTPSAVSLVQSPGHRVATSPSGLRPGPIRSRTSEIERNHEPPDLAGTAALRCSGSTGASAEPPADRRSSARRERNLER
jgi:hypothetical protein